MATLQVYLVKMYVDISLTVNCTSGMTQYDPELNRLRQVIVDKQFRKQGLGTTLGEQPFKFSTKLDKNILLWKSDFFQ